MSFLLGYWTLPILFILHDFEEMVFLPLWKRRSKFRALPNQADYFGETRDGSAFTVGVLEEFVILLTVSYVCSLTRGDELYLCFCVAYSLHFLIHYRMCFRFRGYVPGVVTVTLQVPLMWFIISHYWRINMLTVVCFMVVMVVVYGNLYVMHRLMPRIERRFVGYAQG